MKKILSTIVLLLLAVVTLTACTNKQGSNKDKLRVVTTTVLSPLVRILTNTNPFLMM